MTGRCVRVFSILLVMALGCGEPTMEIKGSLMIVGTFPGQGSQVLAATLSEAGLEFTFSQPVGMTSFDLWERIHLATEGGSEVELPEAPEVDSSQRVVVVSLRELMAEEADLFVDGARIMVTVEAGVEAQDGMGLLADYVLRFEVVNPPERPDAQVPQLDGGVGDGPADQAGDIVSDLGEPDRALEGDGPAVDVMQGDINLTDPLTLDLPGEDVGSPDADVGPMAGDEGHEGWGGQ